MTGVVQLVRRETPVRSVEEDRRGRRARFSESEEARAEAHRRIDPEEEYELVRRRLSRIVVSFGPWGALEVNGAELTELLGSRHGAFAHV